MDDNIHLQDSEAEEEALSLSGLMLNSDEAENIGKEYSNFQHVRRSSTDQSEFFEFDFSDATSEMSPAEDIIFCGKLIPFKEQPQSNDCHHKVQKHPTTNAKQHSFDRKRSESMSELKFVRSNSTKHNLMRNSRSLDYQKLYGSWNLKAEKGEMERSLSSKSLGKNDVHGLKEKVTPRPRWYFFMFGLVKFPSEMDLQDIKSRQVRRNPGTLFTSPHAGEKSLVNRDDRRSSWDLLKVLSCKDDTSVAVTAPFGRLQHA